MYEMIWPRVLRKSVSQVFGSVPRWAGQAYCSAQRADRALGGGGTQRLLKRSCKLAPVSIACAGCSLRWRIVSEAEVEAERQRKRSFVDCECSVPSVVFLYHVRRQARQENWLARRTNAYIYFPSKWPTLASSPKANRALWLGRQ